MIMRSWIIKLLLLLVLSPVVAKADDSLQVDQTKYDRRVERYQRFWNSLIPSQVVGQNAGNMGYLSLGVGWDYGKRDQWETQLMMGFVPKRSTEPLKVTLTLKENFIPWRCEMGQGWDVAPLTCGMYMNALFGEEFWNHQPSRYPNNYYWFSTRFRFNAFVGQRLTKDIDFTKRRFVKSMSVFYEVSSCDIYIIELFSNKHVHLIDVLGLSIGLKFQLF